MVLIVAAAQSYVRLCFADDVERDFYTSLEILLLPMTWRERLLTSCAVLIYADELERFGVLL